MRIIPFVLMIAALLGANYYVFNRIWMLLPHSLTIKVILIVIAVFLLVSPFLSMGLGGVMPTPVTSILYRIGTSWLIIFLYLLILFIILDLLRLTHLLPLEQWLGGSWTGFGIVAVCMAVFMSVGYFRYLHKDRVELSLSTPKTISPANSLKVVAISDLHLGYSIGKKELEGWIELINKEEPDIVLIAGDITDNNVRPLREAGVGEAFKQFKTRYGVFTAPGNHEYIAGIGEAMNFLKGTGINVLRDSTVLVDDNFYIIGRDDRSNPERKSLEELTALLDKTKPILVIDHQPYNLEEVAENGIDLQVSGHTHNGQVWPISLVTNLLFEKDHGYLKKADSHIYVSSGLGIWGGKFRIGTRSEYVVINLQTENPI